MNISELSREEVIASIFATMQDFTVLSGRVTPEHAEAIVSRLACAAAKKRDPITIEVGGVYRNGLGTEVEIIGFDESNEGRFMGDCQISYDQNGRWSFRADKESSGDLIEVISAPTKAHIKSVSVDQSSVDDLIVRLRTSANESENGRNFAGTPQACRQAAEILAANGDVNTRLNVNRRGITEDLGYIAARGLMIMAVKFYRSIYGVDLPEAKRIIEEARDLAQSRYQLGPVLDERVIALEECLRETRYLVGVASMGGFANTQATAMLFENNGAISRLVPSRPQDRARLDALNGTPLANPD